MSVERVPVEVYYNGRKCVSIGFRPNLSALEAENFVARRHILTDVSISVRESKKCLRRLDSNELLVLGKSYTLMCKSGK
jgi:hypothetical protein